VQGSENVTFTTFSLPDCLIVASYIVIFWVMLNCTRYTRIDSDCSACGGTNLRRAGMITLILLVIWLGVEVLLYSLMFLGVVSNNFISIQQGIISFLASLAVAAGLVTVQVKYSGLPFKTVQAGKYMKTVIFITCVWTLGRITHGVIYLIMTGSLTGGKLSSFGDVVADTKTIVLIIVDLLVTELVCYYFVLDYSFFRIFVDNFVDEPGHTFLVKDGISMQVELESSNDVFEVVDGKNLLISDGKGKLGAVYFLGHEQEKVVRKISLSRINKYVLENLKNDIDELKKLSVPQIALYSDCNIYNTEIELIMEYFPIGSLFKVIHKESYSLPVSKKLLILLKISSAMKFLHSSNKCHGHLSSHNILLKFDFEPYIADLGLEHFKKYCGLINSYSNKSAWSSPEILKDPSNVVTKAQTSDDVFSFGMIIWEVIYSAEPFPGYSLNKLRETIVKEELRPRIEKLGINGMEELIKSCWNKIPEHRPDFKLIEKELNMMLNNL
jgi:hypothetical protein